jgi:hypothetical protein
MSAALEVGPRQSSESLEASRIMHSNGTPIFLNVRLRLWHLFKNIHFEIILKQFAENVYFGDITESILLSIAK